MVTSNNESIPVQFPKCRNCKDKDTYLKFCHALGYIGPADWYYCPKCHGLFLIEYNSNNRVTSSIESNHGMFLI